MYRLKINPSRMIASFDAAEDWPEVTFATKDGLSHYLKTLEELDFTIVGEPHEKNGGPEPAPKP